MSATQVPSGENLSRGALRRIFRAHRGSMTRLAGDLAVSRVMISLVLRGRADSRRIEAAIRVRAAELREAEQLARDAGVDRFCYYLSYLPFTGSRRYRPGSRKFKEIEPNFYDHEHYQATRQ